MCKYGTLHTIIFTIQTNDSASYRFNCSVLKIMFHQELGHTGMILSSKMASFTSTVYKATKQPIQCILNIWASSWDYGTYHRRPGKTQASLRIHAVSPEPSLFPHMKYGSRRKDTKNQNLAPLDGCAGVFEEWIYGGWKVPWSHDMAHIFIP